LGIRAYALVGFCIISLLFTQYAFAQFVGCGPNEVRDITGECVSAFADSSLLTISTDKSVYKENEEMYVTYVISERIPNEELSIRLYDPNDRNISSTIISDYGLSFQLSSYTTFFPVDNRWDVGGVYTIIGEYADSKTILTVEVIISPEDSATPPSITVSTNSSSYQSGDTISITGKTSMTNIYVTMMIQKPNGNIISVSQISPDYSGAFGEEIATIAPTLWDLTGTYTVSVQQGENNIAKTTFYFESVPAPEPITVSTNKSSYTEGDTIIISGNVGTVNDNPLLPVSTIIINLEGDIIAILQVVPSSDGSFSHFIIAGGTMQITGNYEIKSQYGGSRGATTFYFESSAQTPEDCGPNQVFQLGVCQDIDEPTPRPTSPNTVFIAFGSSVPGCERTNECFIPVVIIVNVGDTVKWENKDSAEHTITSGSAADGPDGNFDSSTFRAGYSFSHTFRTSGEYPYFDLVHPWMAGVVFVKETSGSGIIDTVPPLLLTPSDMTIDASDSSGVRVDYSVKAIDDNDGILRPNCSPSSGSLFPIGKTTVTCSATDSSGNSDRKSFLITVKPPDVLIPSWIKDVAGFWCGDEIDDASFIEALQYLINNDVILVPTTVSSGSGSQEIPNWVKSNACWWSQGLITNSDFASGLQYLIGQGIIRV